MEVTEDEIIHDLKIANEVADALRGFNCTLALDDFGAGYSSLARLRQLPFSELKIDRSYVSNCHIDRVNAGLCETIVELGQRFGLKTVAEGIETTHESHKLQAIGCQIGQGYLFAKPMPKAQFIGLMRRALAGAARISISGCTTQARFSNRRRLSLRARHLRARGYARSRAAGAAVTCP